MSFGARSIWPVGYALLTQVGVFSIGNVAHAGALGLGILLAGYGLAGYFGKFHGAA